MDSQINLYEKAENGLVLTGDKSKLLSLLKIHTSLGEELVVAGDWRSADGVEIHITSALAHPRDAKNLAPQLSHADPFLAWLPRLEGHEGGGEYSDS